MQKTRKKIIFVIVEGSSEQTALGLLLSRLFNTQEVYLEVIHGDITAMKGVHPNNIVAKIGDIVKNWAGRNYFCKEDFLEIVHIVDLDGAYIDDHQVVKDDKVSGIFYTEKGILCNYPDQIRKRNVDKKGNIERLSATGNVWAGVPYRVYYMSSNLDHVLYNKPNNQKDEKEKDARDFEKKYKDHLDEFLSFICDSDFSVPGNYKTSWEFIRAEDHSLQRHTNIGIWLKTAPKL